jgi:hypothetical protein
MSLSAMTEPKYFESPSTSRSGAPFVLIAWTPVVG